MFVHTLTVEAALRRPDNIYLASAQTSWTYRQFSDSTTAIATFLTGLNVRKGDRVIISLDNCAEAFLLLFAVVSVGAIAVPLAPTLALAKLQYILNDCQPSLFCGGRSLQVLRKAVIGKQLRSVIALHKTESAWPESVGLFSFDDALSQQSTKPPQGRMIDLDPALIIYTSGSTGDPKGILCSHLNIRSATQSIGTYLGLTQEDRIISFQPFFFDYGLYQSFLAAFVGASLCLERNFIYPTEVLSRIEQQEITVIPFVPTNLVTLFSQQPVKRQPLPTVRLITNTGAPFPVHLLSSVNTLFPRAAIFSMYGLTECKRVSYLPPDQVKTKPTSVGISIPNSEAWIVDDQGLNVGPNSVGQLVVRGTNVTLGYWNDPEATAKAFRIQPNGERWLYTGDYFKTDNDGYLYFVGRNDDLLKVGGYRTSTKEIESTLARLEFVQDVAAVPIPDKLLGSSTKVFVVLRPGHVLTESQIRHDCLNVFESTTLVPKIIKVLPALPRTPSGKIDYKNLAE